MANGQSKKWIFEKDAAMKAMGTGLEAMKKNGAITKTEKWLFANSNAELLDSPPRKGATIVLPKNSCNTSILFMYLRFAFQVENATVRYCCKDVSDHVHFT